MTSDERGHDGLERALRAALRGDRGGTAEATADEGTRRAEGTDRMDGADRSRRAAGAGDITGAGRGGGLGGLEGFGGLGGEEGALAAFRAARDAGLHGTRRTRRRDDWAPGGVRRFRQRSLRTSLAALLASVTLGGVAIAAVDLPRRFDEEPAPVPATPVPAFGEGTIRPSGGTTPPEATPVPASPAGRPGSPPADGWEPACRAYGVGKKAESKAKAKGKAGAKGKGEPPNGTPCDERGHDHVPSYPGQGLGQGQGQGQDKGNAPKKDLKGAPESVPGAAQRFEPKAEPRAVPGHMAERPDRGSQRALDGVHISPG
ncbi:hypothetical protein ABT154_29275 [Streptomyces sp. NPDC001728]|uniref:hypothetical protein n=1 Tax=Streptomyces sp. NPDC001728 TaxID=3154396 RepID=UPI00332E3CC1